MPANWSEEVHRIMQEQNVGQVAYVPDTGLKHVIELVVADKKMRAVPLTTEEEGVALATGAWLAGQRSVLLLQSSGVGNCINMLGMAIECRIPLLMLVTMRGQWGEFNPWQMPMAQATASVLTAMGVIVQPVERADDVAETFAAAGRLAFNTNRVVAVQVAQRVVGAKEFK
ncbi:MAG: thiamine pyrophosphate-binding protein [Betaproteobacteria bacterium]|jgi:sulfopyruvate decarboxylase alpha subunit